MWRKGNWWGCKLVQPLWKTVWRFLKKIKIELPYDPAVYPDIAIIWKDTCTPMFIAALFIIAKAWRQPKCPSTDEWMQNMWYTYTVEYYSAIKNNAICRIMDATGDYHTKAKMERQIYYHLYVDSKTWHKWTCLQNRNRLPGREIRLVLVKGEEKRKRVGLGIWG